MLRSDAVPVYLPGAVLRPVEREILYLASLAPSGHNTQPWFVKYIEPFHWIVCSDRTRWLPVLDPNQRETILSIGAFLQNLRYAARHFGYSCAMDLSARSNQDENIAIVQLKPTANLTSYDISGIKNRRTVRSGYLDDPLRKADVNYLINGEKAFVHFIPCGSREYKWLERYTLEANRIQMLRGPIMEELSAWVRFSSKEIERHHDGFTVDSMEINGFEGWYARHFLDKADVLKSSFAEKSIDKVSDQVSHSGGWMLITSTDESVKKLLEAGMRMQRLFLKVREKGIAMHPMTQILEEPALHQSAHRFIKVGHHIQFILRVGYLKKYPPPVSPRRPVETFIKA